MGSGASTKKVQLLNDAIRKTEEEFDEETKLIFEKMPPKGFVKKDGRHGFLCPVLRRVWKQCMRWKLSMVEE